MRRQEDLEIGWWVETIQTLLALLWSATMLRRVLETWGDKCCDVWWLNPAIVCLFFVLLLCDQLKISLTLENKVRSVSGGQILNSYWIWYSHNISPMIKMSNQNITQCRTKETGVYVMIGRYSPVGQQEIQSSSWKRWRFFLQVYERWSKEAHKSETQTENINLRI